MKRVLGVFLVLPWLSSSAWSADEKAMAVVDKAIKAMGGQERFDKAQNTSWRHITDPVAVGGVRRTSSMQWTVQGLENFRIVTETDADDNHLKTTSVIIINGDQGWTLTSGGATTVLRPDRVRSAKRTMLEAFLPTRPDLLKAKVFDLEWAGEHRVGDRPTVAVKVSGLGDVDATIYFDRAGGLTVKSEARFSSPRGNYTLERVFSDYQEFDGIQVATRIEHKVDTAKAADPSVGHIKEFKILDRVPPDTFTEPK
jgi:hypothetical protein